MKIDVLTLFPEMVTQGLSYSIPSRAQKSGAVEISAHNLRQWGVDAHGNVDDKPYGGGPGMILRVDVAHTALENVDPGHKTLRLMMSPDGEQFTQQKATEYSKLGHIVILCGRYEGFDSRVEKYIDKKVSVGSYVVSGGELPAMIIVDAITRLIPGVLGNAESLANETFNNNQTDYPQFTRPDIFDNQDVPEVLKNGHHAEIAKWRENSKNPTKE